MKDKTVKAMWAMTLLAGLEAWALYNGVDGLLLSSVIAALAGLGGYSIGRKK